MNSNKNFMQIVLIGYREWALNAFSNFKKFKVIKTTKDLNNFLDQNKDNPNLCLIFAGWSQIIKSEIINNYLCICLHPSDLPLFRGGSPIQNQKINGIKKSKLTAFKMTNLIDDGPIIYKADISLEGHMNEIFHSLQLATIEIIQKIKENNDELFLMGVSQDESKATTYKRRKPDESEITIDDLTSLSSESLYQKICSLEDPYPNAFIKTVDNKKLLLKLVEIE